MINEVVTTKDGHLYMSRYQEHHAGQVTPEKVAKTKQDILATLDNQSPLPCPRDAFNRPVVMEALRQLIVEHLIRPVAVSRKSNQWPIATTAFTDEFKHELGRVVTDEDVFFERISLLERIALAAQDDA